MAEKVHQRRIPPMLPHALADADRTADKMSWYLRILPRPAQKFVLRHCTQPVLLAFAIIVFLVILPIALRGQIDEASRGINGIYAIDPNYKYIVSSKPQNPWLELSLTYRQEILTDFTPYLVDRETKCIDRAPYSFEYSRLVGIHPYRDDFAKPTVLLIGDNTDLGIAVWRGLNASGVRVAHTGCQNSVDWGSPDAAVLVEKVNVTGVIVTCPMVLPKFATSNGTPWGKKYHTSYLKGIGRVAGSKNARLVYVAPAPIEKDHEAIVTTAGGVVIETPILLSSNNIIGKTVRECAKEKKSTVEIEGVEEVGDLSVDDVADYVVAKLGKVEFEHRLRIVSEKRAGLRETIETAVQDLQCNLSFRKSPHEHEVSQEPKTKVVLTGESNAISAFSKEKFPLKASQPYLSFVVVGRHDNFSGGFENRVQNFIDSLGKGLERAPLADIELLFVDYATPSDQTPLHKTFTIPPQLRGRTRFVIVPVDKHRKLQQKYNSTLGFFEYIVKNIGIRRARGRFVLSTNPDNLFPSNLFELIATEDFNEGVLYRSVRWDTRDHTFDNATIPQIWQATGEPWRLREFDVKLRCSTGDNRFTVSDSLKKFLDQAYPCGGGDFFLASRRLWDTVWAFNEVPSNPNVDAVFLAKFMKLIPGYARFFIHPMNMHQRHEKKNVQRPAVRDLDIVMEEVACSGSSKTLGNNWDIHKWGQASDIYQEILL
jgi:hypothetical protein